MPKCLPEHDEDTKLEDQPCHRRVEITRSGCRERDQEDAISRWFKGRRLPVSTCHGTYLPPALVPPRYLLAPVVDTYGLLVQLPDKAVPRLWLWLWRSGWQRWWGWRPAGDQDALMSRPRVVDRRLREIYRGGIPPGRLQTPRRGELRWPVVACGGLRWLLPGWLVRRGRS